MSGKEFDIYFRKLYLPLGMYALRILEDASTAEDIVAESFSKTWQKITEGTEIENFKSYMYRVVRNECLIFLRNLKKTETIDEIPDVSEDSIDTSERDAMLWNAIEKLPEKCKQVFLLSKRDGLSNEEIAEEMGISIKTVKNQMTKALSRLREALSADPKPFFLPFL